MDSIKAICVGTIAEIEHRQEKITTGIYKLPVDQPTTVSQQGISGDHQADLEAHGGADKAIYCYSWNNYLFWRDELKRPSLCFGQFGENLTVTGLTDDTVYIGDIYRMGEIVVQVTQPRVPCFKLGIKMSDTEFPKRFAQSGRVGFYLRVLQTGQISVGDPIELIRRDPDSLTIFCAMQAKQPCIEQRDYIRRLLAISALSQAWRTELTDLLTKLDKNASGQ